MTESITTLQECIYAMQVLRSDALEILQDVQELCSRLERVESQLTQGRIAELRAELEKAPP